MSETLAVQQVQWHSDGVFELRLERNDIAFTPGDCLALFRDKASRPYSVASGVDDDYLGFVIRRMPDGELSDWLAARAPGDPVRISPPFGWFRPGDPALNAPCVFFATGTGISPFLSHIRSRPELPPAAVFYGVRTVADAVALDELRAAAPSVHLAVSREDREDREDVPEAHRGRITDLLDRVPVDSGTHYFLCGLDAMIDEISVWLEGQGVALPHIHRECFFNSESA